MKRQVLFIHGAGPGAYDADEKLVASLQAALGTDYAVRYPLMPNSDAPTYESWKAQILKELAAVERNVILVGHSLGGSVLLKVLSEEQVTTPIDGLFVAASPFWGEKDWEVDEYVLRDGFAERLPKGMLIFLYHGREDKIVAFEHLAIYAAKIPQATVRELDGRGHQFKNDLSEVAADIASLQTR